MAGDFSSLVLHLRHWLDSRIVVSDSTLGTSHGQHCPTPGQRRNVLGCRPRQDRLLRLHIPELYISFTGPERHYLRLELRVAFQGADVSSVLGELAKLGDFVVVVWRYVLVMHAVPSSEERDVDQATAQQTRRYFLRIVGRRIIEGDA